MKSIIPHRCSYRLGAIFPLEKRFHRKGVPTADTLECVLELIVVPSRAAAADGDYWECCALGYRDSVPAVQGALLLKTPCQKEKQRRSQGFLLLDFQQCC